MPLLPLFPPSASSGGSLQLPLSACLTLPLVLGRFRSSGLSCLPAGCFAALASTLAPPSLCSMYCQVNLVRCPVLVCVQGTSQRRLPPRPLQACAQVRHVAVAHLQLLLPRLLQLAAWKVSGDPLCISWETSAGHTACDRLCSPPLRRGISLKDHSINPCQYIVASVNLQPLASARNMHRLSPKTLHENKPSTQRVGLQ